MCKIKVWTKQHESIIKTLDDQGRYVAKKEFIYKDLGEHAHLVLETYDWLVKNSPNAISKPEDAEYPIWVSFNKDATMLPSDKFLILELTINLDIITMININKWGAILNYSYIPANEEDEKRHKNILEQYNVSDAQAFMSQFYPQIKKEIKSSWDRLFDDSITLGNNNCYGNIWEVKKEWVTRIIR